MLKFTGNSVIGFTGDESWQFNSKQIAVSKAKFNGYKNLANKYYDELALIDKQDFYDFNRLKVSYIHYNYYNAD